MLSSRILKSKGQSRSSRFTPAAVIFLTLSAASAVQAQDTAYTARLVPAGPQLEDSGSTVDLETLNQRLLILERLREVDAEEAEKIAAKASKASAGEKGFKLESPDGAHSLRVGGFLQALAFGFPSDDKDANINDLFIRRTRLDVRATLGPHLDFRLHSDFAGSVLTLLDAYADLKFVPAFGIRIGKFKPPVGLERLQSVSRLLFPEFSLPASLVPNRDVGAQAQGIIAEGAVEYQVGIFQGTPDGGTSDIDISDDKDFAGRVFVTPFLSTDLYALRGLGLGIAGSYGERSSIPAGFRTQARTRFFAFRATDTLDGVHARLTSQGYYYHGPISLLGEYVISRQAIRAGTGEPEDIDAVAWQVQAGWVLTGEEPSWKVVKPAKPFDLKAGGYGAVQLSGRVHSLAVDAAAFPTFANPASAAKKILAYTAGLNWYANPNLTLYLNYELSTFEGGAAGGKDRDDEHTVITSLNIAF